MKSFNVEILFGVQRTKLVLQASNSAHAIVIAKKIYPNAKLVSARQIK